jgi:hypothetical protein
VEAKNTASQFHSAMGMGKNKAKALQSAMQGLFKRKIAVDVKVVAASYVTRLRDFSVLLTWPPWLG